MKLPVVWIGAGGTGIAFYVWSTKFVETAVSAVVYELWPVFLIVLLSKMGSDGQLAASKQEAPQTDRRSANSNPALLIALGAIGVVVVLVSQMEDLRTFKDVLSPSGVVGVGLALLSGVLSALNIAASLAFARTAWQVTNTAWLPTTTQHAHSVDRDPASHSVEPAVMLWFSLLGVVVGWMLSIGSNLLIATATAASLGTLSDVSLEYAVLHGGLAAGSMVLLRVGNTLSKRLEINAIFFVAPVLALLWLLLIGVELPRLDLFAVGAALVLGSNVLLQRPQAQGTATRSATPAQP